MRPFFPVGLDAFDPQFFHLHQCPRCDVGHKKDVSNSVTVDGICNEFTSCHLRHTVFSYGNDFLQLSWGAAIDVYDFARYEPGIIRNKEKH